MAQSSAINTYADLVGAGTGTDTRLAAPDTAINAYANLLGDGSGADDVMTRFNAFDQVLDDQDKERPS